MLLAFLRDEEGATAIEYGLIAALIAVVILASVQQFAEEVTGLFTTVGDAVDAA